MMQLENATRLHYWPAARAAVDALSARVRCARAQVKEPKRPSSGFVRDSRGRFHNVGGPKGDGDLWPEQYRHPTEWEAWVAESDKQYKSIPTRGLTSASKERR